MQNRTAEKMEYTGIRNLSAAVYQRMAAPCGSSLSHRDLSSTAGYHSRHAHCHHCMEGLQRSPLPRKMVEKEWTYA